MLLALLLSAQVASASDSFTAVIAPVPVSLTAKAALAPTPVFLQPGNKAPYEGMLNHIDRMAVLAYKVERYDKLAKDGVPIPRYRMGWKDWTLLSAVACFAGGGGFWSGQKMK